MRSVSTSRRCSTALSGALLLAGIACAHPTAEPPPRGELLISAGDSTWWVQSTPDGLRLRGSPIALAHFDGRFYELYAADDDRSYPDALFIGQRLFRRDLLTGDSTLVMEDSVVPRLAREYALQHPGERPLAPDEDAGESPSQEVTSSLELVEVHGPYLSFEYHVDIESGTRTGEEEEESGGEDEDLREQRAWHATRRGVVNLRRGREETISSLFGDTAAVRILREGAAAFRDAQAQVREASGAGARRLARSLGSFRFEPASFELADRDGAPVVLFHAPGEGQGIVGSVTIPLAPVAAQPAGWWSDLRGELPTPSPDSMVDRWQRGRTVVLARYDSAGDDAQIVLRDSTGREWVLGRVGGPVRRVVWLDAVSADPRARQGLVRAFEDAALYDEEVRTARAERPHAGAPIFRASLARPSGARLADLPHLARDERTHSPRLRSGRRRPDDAAPGQRPAQPLHLRRGGAEHGGPLRRARGDAPRPRAGDDALLRPRAVQGAHSRQ